MKYLIIVLIILAGLVVLTSNIVFGQQQSSGLPPDQKGVSCFADPVSININDTFTLKAAGLQQNRNYRIDINRTPNTTEDLAKIYTGSSTALEVIVYPKQFSLGVGGGYVILSRVEAAGLTFMCSAPFTINQKIEDLPKNTKYYRCNAQKKVCEESQSDVGASPNKTECDLACAYGETFQNATGVAVASSCTQVGTATGPNPCLAAGGGGLGGVSKGAFSCPMNNSSGSLLTGSYYSKLGTSQHCNAASGYSPSCDPNSRRAKSIDVSTKGVAPVLPSMNGQVVQWKYLQSYSDGYGGTGYVFRSTDASGTNWDLQLLHLAANAPLRVGDSYPSGTAVTTNASGFSHVHITMGKNIVNPLGNCGAGGNFSDLSACDNLDPGWLNADTDAGLCII